MPAARGAPWLVSQVMWSNVMQFVDEEGIRVHELHARARTTRDSLAGLQRWGYVTVRPDQADARAEPPGVDLVVRPTAAGRRAQELWRPLAGLIERRWQARFGADDVNRLREALQTVVGQFDVALPQYLPVVYPTQNGKAEIPEPKGPMSTPPAPHTPLLA